MAKNDSILSRFISKTLGQDADNTDSLKSELAELKARIDDYSFDASLNESATAYTKGLDEYMGVGGQPMNYYSSIGQDLDTGTLQRVLVSESWFYICVSAIAQTIASLPLKLEKKKITQEFSNPDDEKSDKVAVAHWMDASGEPEFQIFKYPNDISTAIEFYWLLLYDLLGTGDAYIYLDKGIGSRQVDRANGKIFPLFAGTPGYKPEVQGMYRINPAMIQPIASKNGPHIEGYGIQTAQGYFRFGLDEMIHVRMPNPVDPFVGLAPIVPVFKSVLLERYTSEHHIRFYKQGARLGGVIKTSRNMSKEQMTRLQRSFDQDYTGKSNHHKTLILPNGMEYQVIEQNPGETSLIEFSKSNREPILGAYRVPPIKVALMDGSTYANALIQDKTFYENAVKPILEILQQSLNNSKTLLKPERNLKISFDLSGVEALQEDLKAKAESGKAQLDAGLTINEVRKTLWKVRPLDGGDVSPVLEKTKQTQAAANQVLLAGGAAQSVPAAQSGAASPTQPAVDGQPLEGTQAESAIVSQVALNGAQVTSMLDVVNRVALGQLPRESGIAMLVGAFGLTLDSAESIMGEVGRGFHLAGPEQGQQKPKSGQPKGDPSQAQPDTVAISDITPTGGTFEERVAQLVAQSTHDGTPISIAIQDAVARALLEGFKPSAPAAPSGDGKDSGGVANPEVRPVMVGTGKPIREPKLNDDDCEDCQGDDGKDNEKTPDERTQAGAHIHQYGASDGQTKNDGEHIHFFILPDGELIQTEVDGPHSHKIDTNSDRVASGPHVHKFTSRGVEYSTLDGGGEHYHEFGTQSTPLTGSHTHILKLKDGTEIHSLTESDIRGLQGGKGNQDGKGESEKETSEKETSQEVGLICPFSKEQLTDTWKTLSAGNAEKLVDERKAEVRGFFDRLSKVFSKSLSKKLRGTWIGAKIKADDSDDMLPSDKELAEFIKAESAKASEAMAKAAKHGFENNLVEFKLKFPETSVLNYIQENSATNVQRVTDTTKEQMRQVIHDSVEAGDAVGETAKKIHEYFSDVASESRAQTISRTETLQAISMGQEAKNQEFKKEFPDQADNLQKIWITSKDDRVRGDPGGVYPDALDSHFALEGEIVAESEAFSNGLAFPRDPSGGPEQIINCRCAFVTFLKQDRALIEDVYSEEDKPSEFSDVDEGGKNYKPEFTKAQEIESTVKVERKPGESMDDCVSRGIATLIGEGYDESQAAAIAYSMCGEGKIDPKGVLQTIIVNKEIAKTLAAAEKVAKKYGTIKTSRETDTSFRFAQRSPDDFKPNSYRSFNPEAGVTLVYGELKEGKGGEGSGCHGDNCGRPNGGGGPKSVERARVTPPRNPNNSPKKPKSLEQMKAETEQLKAKLAETKAKRIEAEKVLKEKQAANAKLKADLEKANAGNAPELTKLKEMVSESEKIKELQSGIAKARASVNRAINSADDKPNDPKREANAKAKVAAYNKAVADYNGFRDNSKHFKFKDSPGAQPPQAGSNTEGGKQ